jgi:hypothetical protein
MGLEGDSKACISAQELVYFTGIHIISRESQSGCSCNLRRVLAMAFCGWRTESVQQTAPNFGAVHSESFVNPSGFKTLKGPPPRE